MALQQGKNDIGNYWRNGKNGKTFYYGDEDAEGSAEAKAKAELDNTDVTAGKATLEQFNLERSIFLSGEFYSYMAEDIVKKIISLNAESAEDINIFINSPGGNLFALEAIRSAMKGSKAPVNTICLGLAASCGSLLLASGNKRYIGKSSKTMIHKISAGVHGTLDEMNDGMEYFNKLNKEVYDEFSERTGQSSASLDKLMYKRDIFMSADQTVAFGLADAVLLNTDEEIKNAGFKYEAFNSAYGLDELLFLELSKSVKNEAPPQKQEPEGEPQMIKRDEAVNALLQYGVDVKKLQSDTTAMAKDLTDTKLELKNEKDAHAEAKKELLKIKNEVEKKEKADILAELKNEGKIGEADEKAFEIPFANMSVEQCREFAKNMSPKMNMNRESSGEGSEATETVNGAEDDKKVMAYMKEHNVDYPTAAMAVI